MGRPRWAPHAVTTTARHEPFGRAVSPSPSAGRGLPHPPGAGTQKWCACLMMKCTTDAAKDSRHKERTTRLARVLRHSNECPRHDATATICTAGMHVIAWRQASLWMWTGLGLGLLVLHRCGAPHRTGAGRTMWRTWLLLLLDGAHAHVTAECCQSASVPACTATSTKVAFTSTTPPLAPTAQVSGPDQWRAGVSTVTVTKKVNGSVNGHAMLGLGGRTTSMLLNQSEGATIPAADIIPSASRLA